MAVFAVRRLGLGIVILAALSAASFFFFASRTDPFRQHAILPQYWTWLRGVGDGSSLHPLGSAGVVLVALGHTLLLLAVALVLVIAASIAFAIVAARFRGSTFDLLLRALGYLAWGTPVFLLALLVQQLVNVSGSGHGIGPFPIAGWPGSCPASIGLNAGTFQPCPAAGTGISHALNVLRYLSLPALTLTLAFVGLHGRLLRSALIETLAAPHIATARAKGLTESRIVLRHALRLSSATFAAALVSDFGAFFGAALAVDFIFKLQGLGSLLIALFPTESYAPLNVYAIQEVLLLIAALVVVWSLVGELVLLRLDPRTRTD